MSGMQTETAFHFVDWFDVSGPSQDPATRALIRKQAMSKAAATRKERGNWGKRNLVQNVFVHFPEPGKTHANRQLTELEPCTQHGLASPPSSISSIKTKSKHTSISSVLSEDTISDQEQGLTCCFTVPRKIASTNYEKLRLQCNFDILDLSALTTFHVGRLTTEGLYKSPAGLMDVLECRQWSYFSYIPSRYGHFPCLDDAARCVASRVRGWLGGEVQPSAAVIALYSKALNSLQAAVNDPLLQMEAEVLCAVQILSIYELLDNRKGLGWAQHAAGAKSLLRLRGSQRFHSSFEKALFMAQIGPMYTECLAENLDCFLQDPDWQSVITSIIDEHPVTESPFSDRGTVVISLWSILVELPTLWKDIQAAICSSDCLSTSDLQLLQSRVNNIDTKLSRWRSTYEPLLLSFVSPMSDDVRAEKRVETLGTCLTCLVVLKRLAIALEPLAPSALEIEEQAQSLCNNILKMEEKAEMVNPRAALFMKFKKQVSLATLKTTGEWRVSSLVDARLEGTQSVKPDDLTIEELIDPLARPA